MYIYALCVVIELTFKINDVVVVKNLDSNVVVAGNPAKLYNNS
ncbi:MULTISPECIES: hypothetical protein [Clostridium]|nr:MULTISPECIES: hypothetical protein [Clostridium]NOW89013.1 hypothetical protein [Clostridium beijerinckii]NRZ29219.1 hypothetical protein [Clostridium beijerinckii]NYB95012.1 hypothetical protein [Clostridium beijerinckii]